MAMLRLQYVMACMGDEATTAFRFNVNSNFDGTICYANLLGLASSLSLNSPSKALAKISRPTESK